MNDLTIPVSVIVPNYNSGYYLKELIESINHGLWPAEILVIDDCSTDGSLDLAFKLQSQYKNIQVLQMKSNGGAAEARKFGIFAASQALVALVDADDLLETDALAVAYFTITSSRADICIFELWSFNVENKWRHYANPDVLPKTGRDAMLLTLGCWRMHAAGISKKNLYKTAYQEFSEISFNADELITRLVLSNAALIVGCEKKYFYRSHSAATTHTLNARRLGGLRSHLWLLNFARDYPEAPFKSMVRGAIGEACFYWSNRKLIGKVQTLSALRDFVPKIARLPGIWPLLWRSPKHLIGLMFLSVVIRGGTEASNKANNVNQI